MRQALIEVATGKVVNVILLDDGADWKPPAGHEVRPSEEAGTGDTYHRITKEFTKNEPEAPAPTAKEKVRAKLKALGGAVTVADLTEAVIALLAE